jgi:hypothetical protein
MAERAEVHIIQAEALQTPMDGVALVAVVEMANGAVAVVEVIPVAVVVFPTEVVAAEAAPTMPEQTNPIPGA